MPVPAFPTTYVNKKGQTVPFPRPQKPIPESLKTSNLIIGFESGHEQRRKKSDPKKTFEPTWPYLEQEAYDTLESFFIARGGQVESFTWSHPVTNKQYLVRFDMDALSAEYNMTTQQGHFWKLGIKLIQVF